MKVLMKMNEKQVFNATIQVKCRKARQQTQKDQKFTSATRRTLNSGASVEVVGGARGFELVFVVFVGTFNQIQVSEH